MIRTFILVLFISYNINSQSFIESINHLNTYELDNIPLKNNKFLSDIEKYYLEFQKKVIIGGEIDNLEFNLLKNDDNSILINLIKGDKYYYGSFLDEEKAFKNYLIAYKKSKQFKDTLLHKESLKKIINLISNNRENYKLISKYLVDFEKISSTKQDSLYLILNKNVFLADSLNISKISELKDGLKKYRSLNNDFLKAKYYQMIGVFYFYFDNNTREALKNMLLAEKYLQKKKYKKFNIELFGVYGNIGQYYKSLGNYSQANKYFFRASKIQIPKHRFIQKIKINEYIADNYLKEKEYKKASEFMKLSLRYNDTLLQYKNDEFTIINDLNIKYKTEEKEKKIEETEAKRKQNRNLLIGSILFIVLGGTIATLSLQNSKRKRTLAEQQKELETQKNLNLIKEQELTTINAMVDGQEKERKRIAEDLHDNLGSVLATLKLHFENLKMNREKKKIDQETLFNKTETLIDEAYLKVRSIAHAKNAGVIANQGLLTAVQMMAEKISSADKIKIEVLDFGLDKRLENSLEISVFRIIQELITNVIKHADAKNACINISLYDKNLNIIIEDDGKGFDIKKVNLKDGMGISSIKTRIEHLDGSLNIDATIGKGSSIIIDIPIS